MPNDEAVALKLNEAGIEAARDAYLSPLLMEKPLDEYLGAIISAYLRETANTLVEPLLRQIEAFLAINAKNGFTSPIPGLAVELLEKAALALSSPGRGLEARDPWVAADIWYCADDPDDSTSETPFNLLNERGHREVTEVKALVNAGTKWGFLLPALEDADNDDDREFWFNSKADAEQALEVALRTPPLPR